MASSSKTSDSTLMEDIMEDNAPSMRHGKKTTTERQERKRETNRNAQRMWRERTKSRIEYLENLVLELRQNQQQSDFSDAIIGLRMQLSKVQEERDRLAAALKNVAKAVDDVKSTPSISMIDHQTAATMAAMAEFEALNAANPLIQIPPLGGLPDKTPTHPTILDSSSGNSVSPDSFSNPLLDSPTNNQHLRQESRITTVPEEITMEEKCRVISQGSSNASAIVPVPHASCPCASSEANNEVNLWKLANVVLGDPIYMSIVELAQDIRFSEDTAVRAVVEGWDAVEAKGRLSPLWMRLRQLDEVLLAACGPIERLTMMRLMHMQYVYKMVATQMEQKTSIKPCVLPEWYRERPSQKIPHSYAIDFLCWLELQRFSLLKNY
jgi:hypothetical protein